MRIHIDRADLFNSMLEWEQKADLCLSMGTSMSGMNADRVFTTVAKNAKKQYQRNAPLNIEPREGKYFGGVIIGYQCTQYDGLASLRIFSRIDRVMMLLLRRLEIEMPVCQPAVLSIPSKSMLYEHQFLVPYDRKSGLLDSEKANTQCDMTILDLTPGMKVRLTSGPYKNDIGEVMYITGQGMYQIQFTHEINKKTKVRKQFMRPLGWWWIQGAIEGSVDYIPVINVAPEVGNRG